MLREINLIWEIQVCMSKETEKDATVRLGITEDELHSILSLNFPDQPDFPEPVRYPERVNCAPIHSIAPLS